MQFPVAIEANIVLVVTWKLTGPAPTRNTKMKEKPFDIPRPDESDLSPMAESMLAAVERQFDRLFSSAQESSVQRESLPVKTSE